MHSVLSQFSPVDRAWTKQLMETDEILEDIGSFGFFQKRNSLFLGLIIFVLTFQTVSMVFIGAEPSWRCAPNSTMCARIQNGSTQRDDKARCEMTDSDWEFTTEFTSIVTEWKLICGKEYYASLSQSILFIGWIPGAFIIGRLSDMFGRKCVLFPAVFGVAAASFASSFVPTLWLFLTLRGLAGFFQGGVYITLYVLTTEFVGPKHRGFVGTLVWMFYTASLMSLSGLAYGIREWRTLSIVISAPAFLLLIFWCVFRSKLPWTRVIRCGWVPESFRWLAVHQKSGEAEKVLRSIAKINGTQLPRENIALDDSEMEVVQEGGILDLVRKKAQLYKTLILWLAWFSNSMVYYGVALSAGVLGGSIYLNFFLTSLSDIPSNLFVIWFMNWERTILCKTFYGRKRTLILCMVLASFFCLGVSVIPPAESDKGSTAGRVLFAVLGKFCINASFSTIYVFSTELLPTVIRNVGMGSMAVFDQSGASIAPFIVLLDKNHPVIPFAVMSVVALLAGSLCCLLPETLGQPTLETLGDAKERSRRRPIDNIPLRKNSDCDQQPTSSL